MENKPSKLLKPKEVAETLGVAISTVHKWAWKGEIPCIVLQRRQRKSVIRFSPKALEAWLKKKEIDARRPVSYTAEDDATGTDRR